MLAVSLCSSVPSPLMLKPASRTRFVMKLMTMGAAMANSSPAVLELRPESLATAAVTTASLEPKRPDTIRFPAAMSGELGLEEALARFDHEKSPKLAGSRSSSLRSAPGASEFLAVAPRTGAIDD